METFIRKTKSVCPVCLRTIDAEIVMRADAVYMEKRCPEHGFFAVPVWRNRVDLETWRGDIPPLLPGENERCPTDCAGCTQHLQGVCCALLEVTRRCNLHCPYCFARGADVKAADPTLPALKRAISFILRGDDKPLLQFSGGEPTMRDDLPALIAYARENGCKYTQLNTNGIRLAEEEGYAEALAQAGLSIVFLQFDGVDDAAFLALRGRPLYDIKRKAIENCDRCGIGVTLVPTVVRGVNDDQVGGLLRLGASLAPAVRGVHFQPVSYFGRYPYKPEGADRYTLDELLEAISVQGDIPMDSLLPSCCDHPLCGCHASLLVGDGGKLVPLHTPGFRRAEGAVTARQNREYIGRRWQRPKAQPESCCCCESGPATESGTLDGLLADLRRNSFTITAMAFQDAMNLDIERLRRCSLRVYDGGVLKPFCSRYLTPIATQETSKGDAPYVG